MYMALLFFRRTLLQGKGYAYLLVERSPLHKAYEQEFAAGRETFERIDDRETDADTVYAKKVRTADGGVHVLCLSGGREQKERSTTTTGLSGGRI